MDKQGTYIDFVERRPSRSGRTTRWLVVTRDGGHDLGEVSWFAPWRCYAFFPGAGTLYEKTCLGEIAAFLEKMTKEQRAGWRKPARA